MQGEVGHAFYTNILGIGQRETGWTYIEYDLDLLNTSTQSKECRKKEEQNKLQCSECGLSRFLPDGRNFWEGFLTGWTFLFAPAKLYLAPGGRATAGVTCVTHLAPPSQASMVSLAEFCFSRSHAGRGKRSKHVLVTRCHGLINGAVTSLFPHQAMHEVRI